MCNLVIYNLYQTHYISYYIYPKIVQTDFGDYKLSVEADLNIGIHWQNTGVDLDIYLYNNQGGVIADSSKTRCEL